MSAILCNNAEALAELDRRADAALEAEREDDWRVRCREIEIRNELAAGDTEAHLQDITDVMSQALLGNLLRTVAACPNDLESIGRAAKDLIDDAIEQVAEWARRSS